MDQKKLTLWTAEEQLAEGITWERELANNGTKIYICKAKHCGERRSKRLAMNKHRATHGLLPIPELRKGYPSKSGDVGATYAKKREYLARKKGTAAYKRQVAYNNARRVIKAGLQFEWSSELHAESKEEWVKHKLRLRLADWKLNHPVPEDDNAREPISEDEFGVEDNGVTSEHLDVGESHWSLVAARQAAMETMQRMITTLERLKTQIPDMDVQDVASIKAACDTWLLSIDDIEHQGQGHTQQGGERCCISRIVQFEE